MKPSTEIFARFESKGKPELTKTTCGPVRDIVLQFGKWLLESYMGSHIKLTIARTLPELDMYTNSRNVSGPQGDPDMLAELVAMMAQDTLGLEDQHRD